MSASLDRDPERASTGALSATYDLPTHDPDTIELHKPDDLKKSPKFKKRGITIDPVKTDRDEEWIMPIQREHILPGPGLFIISGTTGSGKTVMLCNLLGKKSMLKNYWKKKNIFIFCLSPCPMLEDCIKPPKQNIIHEDKPELLEEIIVKQKKAIEANGFKKTERKLIIIDDCAQSATFLKSKALTTLAFAATHYRVSVWITSQSYTQIPRRVRINCHYLALFHGARKSEIERFMEEYESPYLTKKEMAQLIKSATSDQFSFLFVNNNVPDKAIQFRKTFDKILRLKKT